MKTKILALILCCSLSGAIHAAECDNKLSWRIWRAQVELIAKQRNYYIGADPDDLRRYYCKGYTPNQAIWHWANDPWPKMGGAQIDRFNMWMEQLCTVAPRYRFKVSDCQEDDSLREWFWLYFFLEGKTPTQAILETQRYDKENHTIHGG